MSILRQCTDHVSREKSKSVTPATREEDRACRELRAISCAVETASLNDMPQVTDGNPMERLIFLANEAVAYCIIHHIFIKSHEYRTHICNQLRLQFNYIYIYIWIPFSCALLFSVVGRGLWNMPTFVALFSGIVAKLICFNYLALTHKKETADTKGWFVCGPIGSALHPFPKIVLLQWKLPE